MAYITASVISQFLWVRNLRVTSMGPVLWVAQVLAAATVLTGSPGEVSAPEPTPWVVGRIQFLSSRQNDEGFGFSLKAALGSLPLEPFTIMTVWLIQAANRKSLRLGERLGRMGREVGRGAL